MDIESLDPVELGSEGARDVASDLVFVNGANVAALGEFIASPGIILVDANESEMQAIYRPLVQSGSRSVKSNKESLETISVEIVTDALRQVSANAGQLDNTLAEVRKKVGDEVRGYHGNRLFGDPDTKKSGKRTTKHNRKGEQSAASAVDAAGTNGESGSVSGRRELSIGGTGFGIGNTVSIGEESQETVSADSTIALESANDTIGTGQQSGGESTLLVGPQSPQPSLPLGWGEGEAIEPPIECPDGWRPIYDAVTGTWNCRPCPKGTVWDKNKGICVKKKMEINTCYVEPPPPKPVPVIFENPTCDKPPFECPQGSNWKWNKWLGKWECIEIGKDVIDPNTEPAITVPDCQSLIDKVQINVAMKCEQLPQSYRDQLKECGFQCEEEEGNESSQLKTPLKPEWLALFVRLAASFAFLPR